MSHRKFSAASPGSLDFLPQKHSSQQNGKVKSYHKDDPSKSVHLPASLGYKARMTHGILEVDNTGSKVNKKEVEETVIILKITPMVVMGIVVALEKTDLKFTDTTSKFGHGHLQTMEDKKVCMRLYKKYHIAKEEDA
ncbi:hypothetical protein ACRRTK_001951 [Alexandromys fortis]